MNKMRVNYIIQHFFLSIFLQNWEDKKMWARRDYFPPYFLYFLFSLLNQIMKNAIFHYIFLSIFSILPVFTQTKHTLGSKSSLSLPYEGVFCFCHSRDNKIIFKAYGVFFFFVGLGEAIFCLLSCAILVHSFVQPVLMEELTDTWRNMSLSEREDSGFTLRSDQ